MTIFDSHAEHLPIGEANRQQGIVLRRRIFGNLDKFRAEPLDTFIMINGADVGMPFDVMIFSGETEAQMADLMAFGPDTKVHVSTRSKN